MKQTKISDFFGKKCERCSVPVYKKELVCLKCNQHLRWLKERQEKRKDRDSGRECFRMFF